VLAQPPGGDHKDLMWEMRTLARFNHRHVVTFYHHFNNKNRLYFVMEFCPGGSLCDRLRGEGRWSEEQVFAWGLELCDTLAFVHKKGIVHHDIKPQNILFAGDGTIKLGDFGVANRHAGTLMYLPPEMLLGEHVSRRDPRIDVYALGLTLLESITGSHPFARLRPDVALQHSIAHDYVPASLPRWVQDVLLKATHPTPELRFQSATDFAEAIRGRHVAYVFDNNRIEADKLAKRAEAAINRKKWKTAERAASHALNLSSDCIPALLAAGRCQLMRRRLDQASQYFSRAVSASPRTPVQKELGWINLEEGRLPTAISMLTDHLQRNAADYEAYNLLLKCFYLTDRFEVALSLAGTLLKQKPPSDCFRGNQLLCRLIEGKFALGELQKLTRDRNPFIAYNATVAIEIPPAWSTEGRPMLKSKLLFQEFQFGIASRTKKNTLTVHLPDGARRDLSAPIVTIGSLNANTVVLNDASVSRRHCAIVNYRDDVWLYDLGSMIGTMVDEQPVEGRMLLDGVHEVAIGPVRIRVASSHDRLL